MLKQFRLSIIFLIFYHFQASGQETSFPGLMLTTDVHRGFIVAHRPMIVPLQQNHTTAFEIGMVVKPDGSKLWHRIYGFPDIGLSLTVWNLGNPDQLGTAVSLIPYLDFPIIKGKKSAFDLKCGWGIGYVEKTFDAEENYKNVAIGSHLNCALIVSPRFKTHITKKLSLDFGISFSHFSNGSVATPNLGLNLCALQGGLSYRFGKNKEKINEPLPLFKKMKSVAFFGALSMKQVYPADGKNYLACSVSGEKMWLISRKSAFGFGVDVFYDASVSQKLEERNMKQNSSLESMKLGIHGGYELVISDFSFVVNMGGYLYSRLSNDGTFYQRVGMRYRFNKHLFALMQLKAHWGKADFIEWGVGFRIDKTKQK